MTVESTLQELSGLLSRSTGVKAKDVLKGLVDVDQFEREIKELSKRVARGGEEVSEDENEGDREDLEGDREDLEDGSVMDENEGSDNESDFDEFDENSDSVDIDEMDPKQQLDLLMAPVDNDDQEQDDEQDEDEDDFEDIDSQEETDKKRTLELDSGESDNDQLDSLHQQLSSYELKKRRLAKQIAELERENVQSVDDSKWTMKGEVRAAQRPENSLLEHVIDFEHATKALPEITEAVTESHEELIKNRIRERAFDDPPLLKTVEEEEPTAKPKKTLDDTLAKDRSSLAQVYERDILKEAGVDAEKSGKEKKQQAVYAELTKMFNRVCHMIDQFSGKRPTNTIVE